MDRDTVTDTIKSQPRDVQENWLRENIERAEWIESTGYDGLIDFKLDGVLLAWIQRRPHYCDRGHWSGQLEFSPGNPLDFADGGAHHYMRRDVAKQELQEKLMWRVCKVRVE